MKLSHSSLVLLAEEQSRATREAISPDLTTKEEEEAHEEDTEDTEARDANTATTTSMSIMATLVEDDVEATEPTEAREESTAMMTTTKEATICHTRAAIRSTTLQNKRSITRGTTITTTSIRSQSVAQTEATITEEEEITREKALDTRKAVRILVLRNRIEAEQRSEDFS